MKNYEISAENRQFAAEVAPMLRMKLWGDAKGSIVTFVADAKLETFIKSESDFAPLFDTLGKENLLFVKKCETVEDQYEELEEKLDKAGKLPKVVAVEGLGAFAHGETKALADGNAAALVKAASGEKASFTEECLYKTGRVFEKIMVVTGSAQGFGQGIAEEIISEGANVVIADLNEELAKTNADKLSEKWGKGKALAVKVDVSGEESVSEMYLETVLAYGGVDALVNNAGIVRAGTLEEMTVPMLDLVTKVNYTAYFLCTKYAVKYMKIQNRFAPEYFMDVIQINSKSGLAGSNKNFAYAGSKFGGIGLTQSFALELTPFNIKVNSVCPGNFLDGPLWTDPEKGLFVQYLNAGKVPGAKTIEDVKKAYEAKVPMNRGCRVIDVVRAIYYCIEQAYETGQAIPVTGGQEMLK